MEDLNELLLEELKDIYSAETQIIKALPKIIEGVESPELKEAIEEHLEVTKGQVTRLDQIFSTLDEKPSGKHCKGMEGLLKEGDEVLKEEDEGPLRDLQLIGAAQRVEHYEMAAYGTARAIAEQAGNEEAASMLQETLAEEEEADATLTQVAEAIFAQLGGETTTSKKSPTKKTAKKQESASRSKSGSRGR